MRNAFLIFIFFVVGQPAFAYIDPGTGGALFSALSAVVSLLYVSFRTLRTALLAPRRLRRSSSRSRGPAAERPIVFYSEGRHYWNVFRPVIEELTARSVQCLYLTSDEEDPAASFSSGLVHVNVIGKGPRAYLSLNALEADVCVMTTPRLDASQLRRSPLVRHYVHLLHAPYDATLYRLYGLDFFDTVLLGADFQEPPLRELERIRGTARRNLVPVGCTYLDVLGRERAALPAPAPPGSRAPTVLLAPSWGENGLLARHGMKLLGPLARSGLPVIIRPHPQSCVSERRLLQALQRELADHPQIEWDRAPDNLRTLARSDVMISDFSGIIFDYCFLFSRPVLRMPLDLDLRFYDAGDLAAPPWAFSALEEISVELRPEEFPDIRQRIERALSDPPRTEAIARFRREAYPWPGEAGRRAADELLRIRGCIARGVPVLSPEGETPSRFVRPV